MKKMKKVLAAVLAATMVIGMMAVSALAEDGDTYNVAGAEGLCGVDWDPAQNQMTDNGDGTWSLSFTGIAAGTYDFKVVLNGAWGTEYNLEGNASLGGGNATVEVAEDNSTVVVSFDGEKALVAVNPVDDTPEPPADDTPTGDASHAALFVVIAAAAAAVLVVAAKKRTVEE